MQPGKLNAVLATSNKQKMIPAIVIDVLGSKCSVRLGTNGQKLTNLNYSGAQPSVGDLVKVDYRSTIPLVITSTGVTNEPVELVTATPATTRPPAEADPREYIEFPAIDGLYYVAKDGDWVEMPDSGTSTVEHDDSLNGDGSALNPLGIAFGTYEPTQQRLDLFDGIPIDTANFPAANSINSVNQTPGAATNPVRYNLYGFGSGAVIQGFRSQGTKITPTVINAGNSLFGLVGNGFDGVDFWTAAQMGFFASENWDDSPASRGTEWRVVTTDDGGTDTATLKFGVDGLNIPAGKTYNIDGVPHTHTDSVTGYNQLFLVMGA